MIFRYVLYIVFLCWLFVGDPVPPLPVSAVFATAAPPHQVWERELATTLTPSKGFIRDFPRDE